MKESLLTDICEVQYGYAFDSKLFNDNEGLPVIRIRDVVRGYSETKTTEKCPDSFIINNGDILIGMDGEFNIARWKGGKALLNQRVCKLIPKYVNADYVLYYMPIALKAIEEKTPFVTVKHLSAKEINKIVVPLPDKFQQRYISKLLSLCDSLLLKNMLLLKKLDELIKSRFVEMFGDPVKNTKHIKTKRGIEIFKLSNGKAVPVEKRFDQGIPAYGGNGISWYTNEILAEQDTLVIGRVGFQSGNVHFARAPLWITDNAMYISSLDNKCYDIIFLCALMEHIDFTRYQDAGDLKKITQKPFMNTEFIAPPIEMQKKYVSFVEQTNKSKLVVKKQIEKLETLKKSLMQEYFG